ncbi:MAG: molybdate ABC transporter permease subunit [Gammaproteobacteria bacterium]|jgi:molybdate transport system permease protein|nr:molybdate ABC transporter permease subunit [Gammaproteobacteria bacterium]MDP6617411.1 molybdate ABC transporter permease subunit [Gammaproteobacteria bacterium]MDP6694658.1 molybdate ABC transporter permease subunit [Gammaproteobacteria bacterium]
MLTAADTTALVITLQLAAVTTVVLLLVGTPLAWWLARSHSPVKPVIDAIVALPLVLPPTVLGFYLLLALGPEGAIGGLMESIGAKPLAFTFTGLVIGSVIYSLPFVVQPLQDAFAGIGRRPLEAAATLRAGPLDRFFSIALPLARPGYLTAAVLGFAHTLGEFGVVLMIGGNIPGSTQVLSIAIYDHVESLQYGQAHAVSAVLLVLSFVLLLTVYVLNRRFRVIRL